MTALSRLVSLFLVFAIVLIAASGCGGDGRLAVEGVATWNGAPIEDGYVELTPTDGKGQIVGADIVQGKFELRTVPGEKRASVTARKKIGERPASERIPFPEPIYAQYLPEQFNERSELIVTIDEAEPKLTLALTGKEAPPAVEGSQNLAGVGR